MKRLFAAASVAAVIGALVFIGCQKNNEPPETPSVPSGSSIGSTGTTYYFSSTAADPDGDEVAMRFDWGDGDTSGWSDWAVSGDSISMSHSWSDSGVFHLKAQARDRQDAASDWSAGHQIEISAGGQNEPPSAPSAPSGPDSGSVGTEYAFVSTAADSDGDSVAIRFDWGDGDTSDWSSWAASGQTISATHSWSDSGTYLIRAQAVDTKDGTSAWSTGHQMVTSGAGSRGWIRTFGGSGYDGGQAVWPTSDGGYLATGYTSSRGAGNFDVYLVKTDSLGNLEWDKTIGGQSHDWGYSGIQSTDGNLTLVGETYSWSVSRKKVLLVKCDFDGGDTNWTRRYGYSNEDCSGHSVKQTRNGGYVILGKASGSEGDFFLVTTDANGQPTGTNRFGGSSLDDGWDVLQTTDGYILVGVSQSHGSGPQDAIVYKVDNDLQYVWHKTYGGPSYDGCFSVRATPDGGFVIAGYSQSPSAGGMDVYLVKADRDGGVEWEKRYGGPSDDWGRSVELTLDGGYIVAGYTKSFGAGQTDVYLVRTDAGGDTVWTRTYGGPYGEIGYSIRRTYQSYIVAGITTTFENREDVYLVRVDANGNVE